YARHLRRSRAVCRERRDALLAAVKRHADGLLEIGEADTGLHTVAWLPGGADDRAVSDAAARLGVHAAPLSAHYAGTPSRPGLILGYASLLPEVIDRAMQRLAAAASGVVRGARNGSGGGQPAAPP
ncbi:MAG TPA: hypothetical protein VFU00_12520, partial [Gemmatimonadales bacterium]|nr:hypothetical protein [Gemmatimonadales bacterium]